MAATDFGTGDAVSPSVSTGFLYSCEIAGLTAATEPVWPLILGDTVADGTITWVCSSPTVVPVDLTDYTAYMSVATAKGATTFLASVSTTPNTQGSIVLGGAAGTILVDIDGETTLNFTASSYVWDLFLVNPSGLSQMTFTGKIKVTNNVTIPVFP
jgi:hypothetical protein